MSMKTVTNQKLQSKNKCGENNYKEYLCKELF